MVQHVSITADLVGGLGERSWQNRLHYNIRHQHSIALSTTSSQQQQRAESETILWTTLMNTKWRTIICILAIISALFHYCFARTRSLNHSLSHWCLDAWLRDCCQSSIIHTSCRALQSPTSTHCLHSRWMPKRKKIGHSPKQSSTRVMQSSGCRCSLVSICTDGTFLTLTGSTFHFFPLQRVRIGTNRSRVTRISLVALGQFCEGTSCSRHSSSVT